MKRIASSFFVFVVLLSSFGFQQTLRKSDTIRSENLDNFNYSEILSDSPTPVKTLPIGDNNSQEAANALSINLSNTGLRKTTNTGNRIELSNIIISLDSEYVCTDPHDPVDNPDGCDTNTGSGIDSVELLLSETPSIPDNPVDTIYWQNTSTNYSYVNFDFLTYYYSGFYAYGIRVNYFSVSDRSTVGYVDYFFETPTPEANPNSLVDNELDSINKPFLLTNDNSKLPSFDFSRNYQIDYIGLSIIEITIPIINPYEIPPSIKWKYEQLPFQDSRIISYDENSIKINISGLSSVEPINDFYLNIGGGKEEIYIPGFVTDRSEGDITFDSSYTSIISISDKELVVEVKVVDNLNFSMDIDFQYSYEKDDYSERIWLDIDSFVYDPINDVYTIKITDLKPETSYSNLSLRLYSGDEKDDYYWVSVAIPPFITSSENKNISNETISQLSYGSILGIIIGSVAFTSISFSVIVIFRNRKKLKKPEKSFNKSIEDQLKEKDN